MTKIFVLLFNSGKVYARYLVHRLYCLKHSIHKLMVRLKGNTGL